MINLFNHRPGIFHLISRLTYIIQPLSGLAFSTYSIGYQLVFMSSYRQLLYHIVFRTKYGHPTINPEHKTELFKYIWGIIKNQEEHHKKVSYKREYTRLLKEHGVNYDERHI